MPQFFIIKILDMTADGGNHFPVVAPAKVTPRESFRIRNRLSILSTRLMSGLAWEPVTIHDTSIKMGKAPPAKRMIAILCENA